MNSYEATGLKLCLQATNNDAIAPAIQCLPQCVMTTVVTVRACKGVTGQNLADVTGYCHEINVLE